MEGQILSGKTALVTGASRGLGKAISVGLGNAGALAIVNYANNQRAADQTVELIQSNGGEAIAIQGDVTDEESVDRLITEVKQRTGQSIDILVNNATGPQPGLSIEENTWESYLDQLNFTVKAPLLLTKGIIPDMKENNSGRIINIGSEVVQMGNANFSNYVTAKSAMLGMTRSWASELGAYGITVNLINPGFIPVERHENTRQSTFDNYAKDVPLGRIGEPNDIAQTVVHLASSNANFITGQSISVNGGNTFGV